MIWTIILNPMARRAAAVLAVMAMVWGYGVHKERQGYQRAVLERVQAKADAAEKAKEIENEVDTLPDDDLLNGILRK